MENQFKAGQELSFNVYGNEIKGKYICMLDDNRAVKIEVTYDDMEITDIGCTANVELSFLVKESEKSKHTQGVLKVTTKAGTGDLCRIKDDKDNLVADCFWMGEGRTKEEAEANAKLMTESVNVANECGLSPSQLLKQRDDLLASINEVVRFTDFTFLTGFHGAAMENLSKLKREIEKTKKITNE